MLKALSNKLRGLFTAKRESYVLVMNLKSRQSSEAVDEVRKTLAATGKNFKVHTVKDPAKLTQAFQKAIDAKPDVIVLGGGDGTLVSGIEYLSNKAYKGEIGILPLGTANYLARNLSIPLDIKGSVETLISGKKRELPLGIANGRLFALTFVLGITQSVSENVSDKRKKKLGQLAYVLELFKQTLTHEAFRYKIDSPALKKPLKGTTHQIIVYNSDLNQQVKLVPDHRLTKPTLKVVISRCGRSKLKLYLSFLAHIVTMGRVRPYMRVFEAESLSISTRPKLAADFDGETYGESPFKIGMYKHKVHILC